MVSWNWLKGTRSKEYPVGVSQAERYQPSLSSLEDVHLVRYELQFPNNAVSAATAWVNKVLETDQLDHDGQINLYNSVIAGLREWTGIDGEASEFANVVTDEQFTLFHGIASLTAGRANP